MDATITRPCSAADLLEHAQSVIYKWPQDFGGFSAALRLRDESEVLDGTVRVRPGPEIEMELPDALPDLENWATEQLSSLAAHRQALAFADGDGRHEVSYGVETGEHPLGTLVSVPDGLRSTYRIRDGWITEIVRHAPGTTVSVHVLDRQRTSDGRFLPRHLASTLADPATGQISQVQILNEQWAETGDVWLPATRASIEQTASGLRYRTLELSGHRLIRTETA